MTIDEMLADIRNQFESEDNCTAFGEPEAWIRLENGRAVQIIHEEEGLLPDSQFFSVSLHCSEGEYDNGYYHETCGRMTYSLSDDTSNPLDIEVIRRPLKCIIKINKLKKLRCQLE